MSLQNSQNLPDATLVPVWCGRLVIEESLDRLQYCNFMLAQSGGLGRPNGYSKSPFHTLLVCSFLLNCNL